MIPDRKNNDEMADMAVIICQEMLKNFTKALCIVVGDKTGKELRCAFGFSIVEGPGGCVSNIEDREERADFCEYMAEMVVQCDPKRN